MRTDGLAWGVAAGTMASIAVASTINATTARRITIMDTSSLSARGRSSPADLVLPAEGAPLDRLEPARGPEPHEPDQHERGVHLAGEQHLPVAEDQVAEAGLGCDELYRDDGDERQPQPQPEPGEHGGQRRGQDDLSEEGETPSPVVAAGFHEARIYGRRPAGRARDDLEERGHRRGEDERALAHAENDQEQGQQRDFWQGIEEGDGGLDQPAQRPPQTHAES